MKRRSESGAAPDKTTTNTPHGVRNVSEGAGGKKLIRLRQLTLTGF
jgi:hypothetical protein